MLYSWFGIIPLYSRDLDAFLRGWDQACTGYYALHWYLYIGLIMVIMTLLIFALQYDLASPERFKRSEHIELSFLMVFLSNFVIAFIIPMAAFLTKSHCAQLQLSVSDCMLFALSDGVWSIIFFGSLKGVQRVVVGERLF
jgi:quinol-cytochrome oxidoreductase complex cytochrome b subunit